MGSNTSFKPAKTGNSRVFIIEGRAGPTHKPVYQSTMKMTGITWGFGDTEKIEVPDPDRFDQFIEVAQISGATERATFSLTGRYALDLKSALLDIAKKGCAFDVQLIFGDCTDPRNSNVYKKKLIVEDVLRTGWNSEDLGALGSDERAKIDETLDVSGRLVDEVVQASVAERGGDVITNELISIVICDTQSCGDCETESDGCQKIFAISLAAGGSPGTSPDVVFSLDGGTTILAHDIDTLSATESPTAVVCFGSYLVITSDDSNSLHYAALADFDGTTDPAFTEVTTGFVVGGAPQAAVSTGNKIFIVGNGGYIYVTEDPTSSVTVQDAGSLFPLGTFRAVDALSDTFAVAVGDGGAIAVTSDGDTWAAVTPFVGVGVNLLAVALKSELEWWVGASNGNLYYTLDGGTTWATKGFSGSAAGAVRAIKFATDTVMYVAHDTATPRGRILKSTDGGYSFVVMPEGSGSFPLNDRVNSLATCGINPDTVFGVGLGDNGTDGFLVTATG